MRVAALISGGKDSMLAAHKVAEEHELAMLITAVPAREDSYMFHTANLHVVDAIAEAMKLPLIKVEVSGVEEREVEEFAEKLSGLDVDAICVGAVESVYQKRRIERVCEEIGVKLLAPLWRVDPELILREVAEKFEAIIVSVSAEGLDESFLGRRIDAELIEELKKVRERYAIHLAGEGGEYETLVLDAPLYAKRIVIEDYEVVRDGMVGRLVVRRFGLCSKNSKDVTNLRIGP